MSSWGWLIIIVVVALVVYWILWRGYKRLQTDKRNAEALQELNPGVITTRSWIDRLLPDGVATAQVRRDALYELANIRAQLIDFHKNRVDAPGRIYTNLWLHFNEVAIEMWQNAPYDSEHDATRWAQMKEKLAAVEQEAHFITSLSPAQFEKYVHSR